MANIDKSGNISAQNSAAPTGNAVTANSTVTLLLANGDFSTGSIQVTGTYTGALTVQATLDGAVWVALGGTTALTNINSATTASNIASATNGIFQFDNAGFLGVRVTALAAVTGTATVTVSASAGTAVVGIDTPISLTGGSTIISTQPTPSAIFLSSVATTNATTSKATAGSLFELSATNLTATTKYVKLYNKATAPTVGTDVPIVTLTVAANSAISFEYGANGKRFTNGISFAITGLQAYTDTTAVGVDEVQVSGSYI